MSIGNFYTASLSEKANLRRDLEGWRGRAFTQEELLGFDVFNVLGTHCQVNVIHNDKGKARITGVMGWPKGLDKGKPENPLLSYSEDDQGMLEKLPEWLQEVIGKQIRQDAIIQPAPDDDFDDPTIPF